MSARRTKIVGTLGPAQDPPGALERLLDAAVDVLRVNLSHASPRQQAARVARARAHRADIAVLAPDFVAVSYVRHEQDLRDVRRLTDLPLIAKIEKQQALERLDAILAATDAVMVARGDLGVEIPIERVPAAQKRLIRAANLAGRPVITATQMLVSMVTNPLPTRAEVTDVANAVLDGTDAVMLSEETAVGHDPAAAVR